MNDLISRREVAMILDKYRVPDSVYHEINKLPEFSADREKGCIDPNDMTHTFDKVTSLNGIAEWNVRGKAE